MIGADMAPCSTLHFRPEGALVGDASFFRNGDECHIFYLSKRNDDPPRLPTCQLDHAVSKDLLHWQRLPTALFPGKPGEPDDDGIGGCSIVYRDGKYHMFYAGTNPQVTYHADSRDLIEWRKDNPLKPVYRSRSALVRGARRGGGGSVQRAGLAGSVSVYR